MTEVLYRLIYINENKSTFYCEPMFKLVQSLTASMKKTLEIVF